MVLLYIDRWLKAPVQMPDGSLVGRERGTPQGGVISPLLANLFLHYAFDMWMRRNFPDIPFERYADDAICHCRTEDQATALRTALETRFADCGLTLHPDKTKRSSIAEMRVDVEIIRLLSSTFSATLSGQGW